MSDERVEKLGKKYKAGTTHRYGTTTTRTTATKVWVVFFFTLYCRSYTRQVMSKATWFSKKIPTPPPPPPPPQKTDRYKFYFFVNDITEL